MNNLSVVLTIVSTAVLIWAVINERGSWTYLTIGGVLGIIAMSWGIQTLIKCMCNNEEEGLMNVNGCLRGCPHGGPGKCPFGLFGCPYSGDYGSPYGCARDAMGKCAYPGINNMPYRQRSMGRAAYWPVFSGPVAAMGGCRKFTDCGPLCRCGANGRKGYCKCGWYYNQV